MTGAVRFCKSRKENPQKLTQLSSRSHPRHLVGKRTAQKDTNIDITSDSQVNSNFPYRWSPACLTFYNYFHLFLHLYITCKAYPTTEICLLRRILSVSSALINYIKNIVNTSYWHFSDVLIDYVISRF